MARPRANPEQADAPSVAARPSLNLGAMPGPVALGQARALVTVLYDERLISPGKIKRAYMAIAEWLESQIAPPETADASLYNEPVHSNGS